MESFYGSLYGVDENYEIIEVGLCHDKVNWYTMPIRVGSILHERIISKILDVYFDDNGRVIAAEFEIKNGDVIFDNRVEYFIYRKNDKQKEDKDIS